jgi:hypothetical protein
MTNKFTRNNVTCKEAQALGKFGKCTDGCPFPECLHDGNIKIKKSEYMREKIVDMFKQGLEPYQIAELTNYSTKTVNTYLRKTP